MNIPKPARIALNVIVFLMYWFAAYMVLCFTFGVIGAFFVEELPDAWIGVAGLFGLAAPIATLWLQKDFYLTK